MSNPTVSVIIPNYNHARYLPQRIESVLNQTYQDFELIILDDCSSDNSREVIQTYASDNKVKLYFNNQNTGSPFLQWSKGVGLAKGKYIWIAESDDFAQKNLLETLVPVLDQRANVGLVYCQSNKVNSNSDLLGDGIPRDNENIDFQRWLEAYENEGPNEVINYLLFKNTIPNASALLFRKSVYPQSANVTDKLQLCGDWLVYVKMLKTSDIYYHPKKLNNFRVHSRTVRSKNAWGSINVLWERSKIVQYIINQFDVPEENKIYAIQPIYFDYLLNLFKLSFRIKQIRKYREVWRFLDPFAKNKKLKRKVYKALVQRLLHKGRMYYRPKNNVKT